MKILIIFGTRPEAIKLAPVIHTLQNGFNVKVLSSGQHVELANSVINFLGIRPDYNFHSMTEKPDLETLYESTLRTMRTAVHKEDPDLIIVQGDTLTTFSGALLGFMQKKPVFHVEAGLRTFNKFSPFPEEMLRILVTRLVCFHFAPTQGAVKNLTAEGVRKDRILLTGNTVVDAVLFARDRINEEAVFSEISKADPDIRKKAEGKKLILVTAHRRENIGEPLARICRAVKELAQKYKDAFFLWSLHKNPEVRQIVLDELSGNLGNLVLAESFSYQTMVYLMKNSHIIITDSGGIQEEAPAFNKPLIILRESTERPEVVEQGIGFLAGSNESKITRTFTTMYENKDFYKAVAGKTNPFGDGKAAEKIHGFLMLDEVKAFIQNYPLSSEQTLELKGKIHV